MNTAQQVHLVNLASLDEGFIIDVKYATADNFTGKTLYDLPICFLHKEVAVALMRVQRALKKKKLGLKVFDGYRPLKVQQLIWDIVQDERYISNPAKGGGRHTRGTAVDVTLVDATGKELEMPTAYDSFTEQAHSDYMQLSQAAKENRALLHAVMMREGFVPLASEWWHFDYKDWNDDLVYPPLDLSFHDLMK